MPNTDGILLGPGPLAKAVAKPYDTTMAWQNGQYCTRDGKIYKFIGEDLLAGESWNASHWAETKVTDEVSSLQAQIDILNPETGTALFTDVSFTINSNQWTSSNGVYSFNLSNALIKATSGIQAFYDESFRTALAGDIHVEPHVGYATFVTDGQPQGALSGTLRIIDSVSGTLPVSKGGTGAVTAKGARQNLNTSIRPICIDFGLVSSLPQTITQSQNAAAADITADMIPTNWVFSNPAACPQGLKCTTALGAVTIGLPDANATFSGETRVYVELMNPHVVNDGGSGQEQNQSTADYVQITEQTLTTQQKSQARDNIGAASAESVSTLNSKIYWPTLTADISSINSLATFKSVFSDLGIYWVEPANSTIRTAMYNAGLLPVKGAGLLRVEHTAGTRWYMEYYERAAGKKYYANIDTDTLTDWSELSKSNIITPSPGANFSDITLSKSGKVAILYIHGLLDISPGGYYNICSLPNNFKAQTATIDLMADGKHIRIIDLDKATPKLYSYDLTINDANYYLSIPYITNE